MNLKSLFIIVSLFVTIQFLIISTHALEFYFNESVSEQSVTASSYRNKTNITFTPLATANYTIIATAEINHSSAAAGQYVGARLVVDNVVYHEILYRPADTSDWYPFAAVKRIELNSSQHSINIQWNATSTGFIRNARIFVMRVDAQYNESETDSTTSSTTPVEKAKLNFTPSSAGDYLIIASANIQNNNTARFAAINLSINGVSYIGCVFDQRDSKNLYGCAGMKNITLGASQNIINLTFKVQNALDKATIKNVHVVAIRLDAFNKSYYNESESSSIPAVARTWYNKTINLYTSTPGRHLVLGSIEFQAGTGNSNRIAFYNSSTNAHNISLQAAALTDDFTSFFMTVPNLTAASQSDRLEYSASGGTLSNYPVMNGRLISLLIENSTPIMQSISASPSPIKGGNVITITGNNIDDPNGQQLTLYCSESSTTPNATNTNCTGGTTIDTTPPYSLSCTYATLADDTTHTVYCRVFDGDFYSNVTNTTYTTDSTSPTTPIVSVADDTAPTYYDNVNDGKTDMIISGEASMLCRYGTSDVVYSSMSNDCTVTGTQANCSATTTTQGLNAYNFYVSCRDSLGNEQNTSQNIDITALVHDWTAPTTSDNSSTTIAVPSYIVSITEADNLFSSATITTKYCTDTSGSCTPNTAIDSGGTITFTSSNRGVNFLRYNSSDPAGNVQTIQNKTININQLPVFTSANDNATTIKGGSGVLITTDSYDADSGQTLSLFVCNSTSVTAAGCGATTYCSNTTSSANASCSFTSETDDTTHTWYAFLYDSLNESATTNTSGSYITDSTAPTITIINPQNQTYSETSVSAQLILSETGSWAGYSLDSAANVTMINSTPTFWSATISSLSNGAHTVSFYANDSYGNVGTNNKVFSVDTTLNDTIGPSITVWSPTNGTYYTSASILANITLSEAGSNATYSLNGTVNVSMGNVSTTSWNVTLTLSDGLHNITFYANDSSTNKNTGNSSTIYFYVDTSAPQNTTQGPTTANDTANITCYAQWSDNIALDYGYLEHNATGTATNSSQISLSGTSGWTNVTIAPSDTIPGIIQCKAYAYDKAGLANSTSWFVNVTDATNPLIENISYLPNTTDDLDPNVMINITANASDNVALSKIVIQYKQSDASIWSEREMFSIGGTGYKGNFTPNTAGNWTFRIYANDTSNNTNISSSTTINISFDYTWTTVSTISTTKTIVQTEPRNIDLGNITINNTGDYNLNFTVSSDKSWIIFNGTNTSLSPTVNSAYNITKFNVTANTTGFAVGSYAYAITIRAYNSSTLISSQTLSGTVVIQNVAGPYFIISINTYDATVTQGDSSISLSASVENAGTGDATGTWLAWTLPSGWSNSSGVLNKSIGFLGVGSTVTNDIKVSISDSATTGSQSLQASAGSSEGITGSDSKTVTVSSPTPTQTVTTTTTVTTGGGGVSTATLIEKVLAGKEISNSSETFELVRGYSNSFPVTIKNIFSGTTLENVSIKIEGLLSQYMSFSPTMIDKIAFNEMKQFNVTIMSPEYMEKGTHELSIIVTGKIVGPGIKKDLTDTRNVNLVIHTVSGETANMSLEQAIGDINEMEKAGFLVVETSKLLEQAKQALRGHDYDGAKDLGEKIRENKETAFNAYSTMQELRNKISTYRSISKIFNKSIPVTGLFSFPTRFSETENVLNLAQAAFEREDFATALQRTKDAEMTFALERGNFNLIFFSIDYWWVIILSVTVLSTSGIFGYQIYIKSTITQRIINLKKEEDNIRELIIETQKKHFKEKTIGVETFHKTMSQFQKRLSKIMQSRVELRHKRTRLLKPQKVIKDLDEERKEIENLLKNLQKDYFVKHKVSRAAYEDQAKVYNERLIEIEDEQLTLETKLHMGGKKK